MSSNTNANETIQQQREQLLQAQAARQRAREEEDARQEAEFAAEMARVEEEEKQLAEEKRVAEEKQAEEITAEAEDERVSSAAFAKLVEENRVEWEKTAKELERWQKHIPAAQKQAVTVVIPPRVSGSTSKKGFKSRSVISDESDDMIMSERVETPRPVKRKCPIKMITQHGTVPDPTSDRDAEENDNDDEESPSQPHSACTRCMLLGKTSSCKPQSMRQRTQACEPCHVQRQRCSWIGEHASRRSRRKWAKVEDEIYQGPAATVGERKFEGSGVAEQLATIVKHSEELVNIARRSLGLQERMLHLIVRRERREEAKEELEKNEDEDEDGEGEEDEEEVEETRRKNEIREGKKRAE
ncbi:hypothetical protein F5050DRAFT_1812102 [Lentinula boryana]|uniref:Zn(2)-C6 fungal-type domain-containing protein n=1 Tax=Lentinula boryana TaxID=40481 RepID=A0ABQ8PZN4_9AGAR|nr:hypothetical protein F5050DRAFT_1812102 [Lentinula boryana]